MNDRLPTHVWVESHLRKCTTQNMPVYVAHKGERHSGMVMLKIVQGFEGCKVLGQIRNFDGELEWMTQHDDDLIPEREADEITKRAISIDPDLWVVEIESRDGTNPFE